MKKSDLKRLEEIARKEDEQFSMDDVDIKDFIKTIDKYLPEHLKRFKGMTDDEIDAAIADPDFEKREKERFEECCKSLFDPLNSDEPHMYADERERIRIMEAELHSTEISDRDRLMFNIDRFFPEFQKHYKEGTIGSDRAFCRNLKKLIEFGDSIGEDTMSELILRMNLR